MGEGIDLNLVGLTNFVEIARQSFVFHQAADFGLPARWVAQYAAVAHLWENPGARRLQAGKIPTNWSIWQEKRIVQIREVEASICLNQPINGSLAATF